MCLFINAEEHRRIDRQVHIRTSSKKTIVYVHGRAEITEADSCGGRCLCCTRAKKTEALPPFSCSGPSSFIEAGIGNSPGGTNQRHGRSQARKKRRRRSHIAFEPDRKPLATCRLDAGD